MCLCAYACVTAIHKQTKEEVSNENPLLLLLLLPPFWTPSFHSSYLLLHCLFPHHPSRYTVLLSVARYVRKFLLFRRRKEGQQNRKERLLQKCRKRDWEAEKGRGVREVCNNFLSLHVPLNFPLRVCFCQSEEHRQRGAEQDAGYQVCGRRRWVRHYFT